ncbi:MAG: CCGSCS motif protein [Shewanella sp.]
MSYGVYMSVSFKKIFGLNKSESQASVLTPTKTLEKTAKVEATNAAVKAENAKHGDNGVCCGSCSN